MFTLDNFYQSKEWISFISNLKVERVNDEGFIICGHCNKAIVSKYDCIGHHITHLTEDNVNDYNISLNPDNVMLVHHKCHNKIHNRFNGYKKKQVYLVYGAPCSGKSTWVNKHAGRNDLILDIDKIYQCISINKEYIKPNSIKNNVFQIRDCILDMIKTRYGFWENAYIIGGYPFRGDRERLQRDIGAVLVYIEATKEECINRAKQRPKEWIDYIENYFEKFQE